MQKDKEKAKNQGYQVSNKKAQKKKTYQEEKELLWLVKKEKIEKAKDIDKIVFNKFTKKFRLLQSSWFLFDLAILLRANL